MQAGITHLICARDGSLAEVCAKVKEAGYDGMEVLATDYLKVGSTAAELDAVRETFDNAGLEMYSMCGAGGIQGSLATGDESDAEAFYRTARGAAQMAAYLDIDTILIVPGGVTPDVPYDAVIKNVTEGLKKLTPIAEESNVSFAVEYVWNDAFLSPLEMRDALDAVNHPLIGFYMDTGNMLAFGWPEQWIRILAPYIKRVHVKNFRRRPYWDWPSLLSVGDCNWSRVMPALKTAGYDGPLISEASGTWLEHAENCKFIRQLIASVA